MNHVVLDNVLPSTVVDYIESKFQTLPFYYVSNITEPNNPKYLPGFNHQIFQNGNEVGVGFDIAIILLQTFANKISLKVNDVLSARVFLQLPTIRQNNQNVLHRDLQFDHLVFLYYASDSSGSTYLFNKTSRYDSDAEKIAEIEPKKGRGLFFNGKYYHCSSAPNTEQTRLVLNLDFL